MAAFPAAKPLFTSSTSVYPQIDGSTVDESSDASPDKDTGSLLRETEELVVAGKGIVARLAGIYGPGRSFVLRNLLEGKAAIEGNDGPLEGGGVSVGHCRSRYHRGTHQSVG